MRARVGDYIKFTVPYEEEPVHGRIKSVDRRFYGFGLVYSVQSNDIGRESIHHSQIVRVYKDRYKKLD